MRKLKSIHEYVDKREAQQSNKQALSQAAAAITDPLDGSMPRAINDVPKLHTPQEVAAMLCISERTLERWRIVGDGPTFIKVGPKKVRYAAGDVANFVASRAKASTVQ